MVICVTQTDGLISSMLSSSRMVINISGGALSLDFEERKNNKEYYAVLYASKCVKCHSMKEGYLFMSDLKGIRLKSEARKTYKVTYCTVRHCHMWPLIWFIPYEQNVFNF